MENIYSIRYLKKTCLSVNKTKVILHSLDSNIVLPLFGQNQKHSISMKNFQLFRLPLNSQYEEKTSDYLL